MTSRQGGDRNGERHDRPTGAATLIRLGAGMALMVFGGYLLDRAFGTEPVLLLVGAVLGVVVVMYDLVRRARG